MSGEEIFEAIVKIVVSFGFVLLVAWLGQYFWNSGFAELTGVTLSYRQALDASFLLSFTGFLLGLKGRGNG